MAVNSFNNFTELDAVNGVFQQEPRVFAHDAVAIQIGAINNSAPNHGLKVTNSGSSYQVNDVITLTTGAGATTAAKVKVLAIDSAGAITNYEMNVNSSNGQHESGAEYVVGDTLTQASASPANGSGFAATVSNIDIPHTSKRGACVYVGNGGGNLTVVMESGSEVTFKNVVSGQFLPILIKRLVSVSGTLADVLALY